MSRAHDLHRRFETLLQAHRRIVLHVARLYAAQAADREDLAQEIRIQLWRAFPSYDASRAAITTWMYRIALNVGISHLRQDSARAQRFEPWDDALADTVADPRPAPGAVDPLRELAARVERLGPLDRALVLLYLDDRPAAEIADVLGISASNVGTRIDRIKQRWRREAVDSTDIRTDIRTDIPTDIPTEGSRHGTR